MTDEPTSDRDPLEVLAEDFASRQRMGLSPSVAEYASAHPELAEQIRELFPTIAAMERLKARSERSSNGLASLGPVQLERLGDFRIIREIGRGGMGIVYEAEQVSLGRRVALKVLPRQALLEERQLARFKREAQLASRLHHTNIVQVYSVGEEDGFHFYTMQHVGGVGLDRVIENLSHQHNTPCDETLQPVIRSLVGEQPGERPVTQSTTFYRAVARLGVQAAGALAYAHEHGTLHRDIKPSNLLLDEKGSVWIADFGLAHAAEASQVTQAGDLTGTLRYLAPERLGGRTDERSDIYSLGLTLYELLTLQPAYGQTGRSALIHQVSQHAPAPLRSLNATIPRDIETVVLKATARQPEHRYATAAELADDLRRFVEDRPIHARRVGPAERLWRWSKRNKPVAALSATTALLLVAVAVVASVGYVQTRSALQNEATQRQRAEFVAGVAGEALDKVFARLGPNRATQASLTLNDADGTSIQITGQPAITQETAALLEEMLPFYDQLAEPTDDNVALQRRAADARRRVGDIRQLLGQYDQSLDAYRKAIEAFAALIDTDPADTAACIGLAETCNELGRVCRLLRRVDDANQAHERALRVLQSIDDPTQPAVRFARAQTHYLMGVRVAPEVLTEPPGHRGAPRREVHPRWGPRVEARVRHIERAIELLKQISDEQPQNPDYRYWLALCYREYVAPPEQGHRNVVDQAIELLEQLVEEHPHEAIYRFDLCETYAAVEAILPGPVELVAPQIADRLDKALALSKRLTSRYPNRPRYLASQAHIYHKRGDVFRKLGMLEEAEHSDRLALERQTQLADAFPQVVTYQVWEAMYRNHLARIVLRRGKPDEAVTLAEMNTTRTAQLLEDRPEMWYLHAALADAHRTRAHALRRTGDVGRAAEADSQARAHRDKLREMLENRANGRQP